MIIDGILLVLQGVLNVLLSPLALINITIDFIGSIPIVSQFFQVVGYIVPWSNLLPLFILVIAIVSFKIVISIIKTVWDLLPFA